MSIIRGERELFILGGQVSEKEDGGRGRSPGGAPASAPDIVVTPQPRVSELVPV